jgi:NAD-dependent deacetylase
MDEKIDLNFIKSMVKYIKESKNTIVLTGAGMSTESGIPDFRGKDGLYKNKYLNKYTPEVILSHSFFYKHPNIFWDYLNQEMNFKNITFNDGHKVLAKLEEMGLINTIFTQNIDELHQSAGSKNVIELHGTLKTSHCTKCNKIYNTQDIIDKKQDIYCDCRKTNKILIRPDIVLYEESVPKAEDLFIAAKECDLLIVLGTSLNVMPVSSVFNYLKPNCNEIIINKDRTGHDYDDRAITIHNSIGKALNLIEEVLLYE